MKTPANNTVLVIFAMMIIGVLLLIPFSFVAAQVLQPQPSVDPEATVQAMVAQTMLALTLSAPTQTPVPPTPIVIQITNTPAPTATALPPTAQPVTYCDWAAFIKDVTVPDGTAFSVNETFTKTWRLQNRGNCSWTQDYMLVYSSGAQMGGTTAIRLPQNVAPGQYVDVSVVLTAPASDGSYTGYWMLRNSSGVLFGTGEKANKPFYVEIKVKKPAGLPHATVSGNLCYPSEFNPPMTLYFEKVATNEKIQFTMTEAQNAYSVLIPNGSYYVYAWAPGYNLEGAYTDLNTHLMKPIQVNGQNIANINLCDWSPTPHGRGQ